MTNMSLSDWIASLPRDWTLGLDAALLDRARSAYQSAGRYYHTWEHVHACVEHLRSTPCEHPRLVFLALVFHDAVYVAGRGDNEEQSARLAREALSESGSLDDADLAAVERMILKTKNHHAHIGDATADEAAMLDIDLSILAAPRDEYARYARAIHDEWVPAAASDAAFRIGRLDFLRRLLAAPHVYLTPEGRRRWDAAAHRNLEWEMDQITSPPSPLGWRATT
jgi:predicted metal-dependent HD superfamily phosphohydrolase